MDSRALRFTREYLLAFDSAVAKSKNSADLIAALDGIGRKDILTEQGSHSAHESVSPGAHDL
jgi:hypothetical protein